MYRTVINGHEYLFGLRSQDYYRLNDMKYYDWQYNALTGECSGNGDEPNESDTDLLAVLLSFICKTYSVRYDGNKVRHATWNEIKDFIYSEDFKVFFERISEDPKEAEEFNKKVYEGVMPIIF